MYTVFNRRAISLGNYILMLPDTASTSIRYSLTLITIKLHVGSSYCDIAQSSNGYRLLLECKRSSQNPCMVIRCALDEWLV